MDSLMPLADGTSAAEAFIAHLPEALLVISGLFALLIVATYLRDPESWKYRILMFIGVFLGVAMVALCWLNYSNWSPGALVIIAVAGFALMIRPFREVHFAVLLALFVMVIVYILLANLAGGTFEVLSEGGPRFIVAFLVAGLVYGIAKFAEDLVKIFGKILNLWPVLAVLGAVCILEGVAIYTGSMSVSDMIMRYMSGAPPLA